MLIAILSLLTSCKGDESCQELGFGTLCVQNNTDTDIDIFFDNSRIGTAMASDSICSNLASDSIEVNGTNTMGDSWNTTVSLLECSMITVPLVR